LASMFAFFCQFSEHSAFTFCKRHNVFLHIFSSIFDREQ
jgi:hypothetical protein